MGGLACETKEPEEDENLLGSDSTTEDLRDKEHKSKKLAAGKALLDCRSLAGT